MKLTTVMRALYSSPWAILPSQLAVILEIAQSRVDLEQFTPEEIAERIAEAEATHGPRAGAFAADSLMASDAGYVAVLPVYGTILPHASIMTEMSGGTSVDELSASFRAAMEDPAAKAVILDVDSPGGDATGLPELAAEMRAQRGRKPVIAVANYLMASGAYWIASQADEIVASPSALVGSVGVYAAHQDLSAAAEKEGVKTTLTSAGKYKTEGNPYEPLTEEAQAHVQSIVDETYRLFTTDIAAGRGVKISDVQSGYGEGRVLPSAAAREAGLVDTIEPMSATVARVVSMVSEPRSRSRTAALSFAGSVRAVPLPEGIAATMPQNHVFPFAGTTPFVDSGHTDYGSWTIGVQNTTVDHDADRNSIFVDAEQYRQVAGLPENDVPADRREQMDAANPEPKETEVSTEAIPASAAQVDPDQAELLGAVHQLSAAVKDMNEGRVDRETVDRMAEELTELRAAVDANTPKTGFTPDDVASLLLPGRIGLAELHQLPARAGAAATRIPVEDVREFHRVSDNLLILSAALGKAPEDTSYYADSYLPVMRAAMDSVTTAEGDEFVPTLISGDLIERVELLLRVVALFRQIDMPSNPYEIPGFGVRTRGGRASENTADTGQTGFRKVTPATRKITLTAVKFAAEALVSKELEEDSIVPILDFIRDELVSQLAHDQEDAIINGDTTGPHQDSDVTDALDPRKNWMGLRKLAVAGAKTDGSNAILTAAMLRTNRKKMGKYGVGTPEMAHLIGIGQYVNLLADANVLTVDKYGPNATIKTGELASIDGIAIIVSEYVRQDLNATGVYDGVTTNRSEAITVHAPSFMIGNRRGVTVQLLTELYAEYDQDAITVSMRRAFAARQVATETMVAITYNLAA